MSKGNTDFKKRGKYHLREESEGGHIETPCPKVTPMDYFINGELVKEDLFTKTAETIARSIDTKASQIRKFYDDILRKKMLIELSNDKEQGFKRQLPYIKMLIAKANYGFNRGVVKENFKAFLEYNLGNLSSLKEFLVFCDLFEAVIAYSKKG